MAPISTGNYPFVVNLAVHKAGMSVDTMFAIISTMITIATASVRSKLPSAGSIEVTRLG